MLHLRHKSVVAYTFRKEHYLSSFIFIIAFSTKIIEYF